MTLRHIVVVGTGATGLGVLETLRRGGYDGQITMVGDETALPYDRPPLSKRFLTGEWNQEQLNLRSEESLSELSAGWMSGCRASGLDTHQRRLFLDDGTAISYDELVIATGVRPRWLPLTEHLDGAHVLRTVGDAIELRQALTDNPELVVVGGGFLGAETAAAVATLGCEVTLLSSEDAPLAGALGSEVATVLAARHHQHGVRIEQGRAERVSLTPDGSVDGILLEDGRHLPGKNVLMTIGSHPNVEWLEGSGIPADRTVECDERGQVAPGVWAAGDVAAWWHPEMGRSVCLEHRTNATEQGMNVARSILGQPPIARSVPYVWSDQYDVKVQVYGFPRDADSFEVVDGNLDDGKFTAVYGKDGVVCAAVGANMARSLRPLRTHVAARTPWADLDRLQPAAAAN
ncbi:NAD(P)/FAD-dependent oxidoreductase [Rothia uropygioeca]|uniref:NAD(P)/FAD-dependent oxidoreductase n=1 Tax=Kocuria sp. 257 TaxID=2021970 RepID=UPI0010119F5A|nr:FAD/NAD(P)-binding oxidoreductase [Kocuria sp. 257]